MIATLKFFLVCTIATSYVTLIAVDAVLFKFFCAIAITLSILALSEIHYHGREVKR